MLGLNQMPKADLRQFDYQEVARLDAEMWRAYYSHRFARLFWQLLGLIKSQLGLGWLTTFRLAYYSGWAAADYRLHRHSVNRQRVEKNLIKFYKIVSASSTESFDFEKAGKLELLWWDVHRASNENNEDLEQSLANAAAAMYSISSIQLKSYAHYRAEAMILPRHTGDKDNFTDWEKVHDLLARAWKSLYLAVQKS